MERSMERAINQEDIKKLYVSSMLLTQFIYTLPLAMDSYSHFIVRKDAHRHGISPGWPSK